MNKETIHDCLVIGVLMATVFVCFKAGVLTVQVQNLEQTVRQMENRIETQIEEQRDLKAIIRYIENKYSSDPPPQGVGPFPEE